MMGMKKFRLSLLALVLTLFAAACGGSDPSPAAVPDSAAQAQSASDDDTDSATTADESDDAAAAARQLMEDTKSFAETWDEQTTPLGAGRVLVAIDCDNAMGQIITFVSYGLTVGELHEGEITPAIGSPITISTGPDGIGGGGSQSTFDEGPYKVSFPTIDRGMTFTLGTC